MSRERSPNGFAFHLANFDLQLHHGGECIYGDSTGHDLVETCAAECVWHPDSRLFGPAEHFDESIHSLS